VVRKRVFVAGVGLLFVVVGAVVGSKRIDDIQDCRVYYLARSTLAYDECGNVGVWYNVVGWSFVGIGALAIIYAIWVMAPARNHVASLPLQ
jgi:hypothetical protein